MMRPQDLGLPPLPRRSIRPRFDGRKRIRGSDGRFLGERVNLESVPRLPAVVVAQALAGGRAVRLDWPPLFTSGLDDAVTLLIEADAVVARRPDGDTTRIRVEWRPMPRRGGRAPLLCCSWCSRAVRHLYGWCRTGRRRVIRESWRCRLCAGLRYVSEGSWNVWRAYLGPPARAGWDPEVHPVASCR